MNQDQSPPNHTLKHSVLDVLTQARLPDEQIDKLLAMQAAHFKADTDSGRPAFYARIHSAKLLASSAAVITLIVLFSLWIHQPVDYTRQIALEAVNNHLHLKPLDIRTQSIDGIRGYFTQLDFAPVRSLVLQDQFALSDANLLGGRYCSIKGVTAAQLHYQPGNTVDSGAIATFYQAAYDPNLHGKIPNIGEGEAPKVLSVKGLEVSLWVEKGLLLMLVNSS